MPASPAAKGGFGRGYVIGFFICFGLVVASFVALLVADDDVARVGAFGYLLISFGTAFAFGMVYHVVINKGFPWTVSALRYSRSGVLDRRRNFLGFWTFTTVMLLIFSLLIGSGVWVRTHASTIAAALERRASE